MAAAGGAGQTVHARWIIIRIGRCALVAGRSGEAWRARTRSIGGRTCAMTIACGRSQTIRARGIIVRVGYRTLIARGAGESRVAQTGAGRR